MIHKYYDYRRPLFWVAAFLTVFIQTQVSFKQVKNYTGTPFVKNTSPEQNIPGNDAILLTKKYFTFYTLISK